MFGAEVCHARGASRDLPSPGPVTVRSRALSRCGSPPMRQQLLRRVGDDTQVAMAAVVVRRRGTVLPTGNPVERGQGGSGIEAVSGTTPWRWHRSRTGGITA